MARLFVAVWPPPDVVAVLAGLPRDDEPGVRFVPPANWHVTLRFLSDTDPAEVIDRLHGAAAAGTSTAVAASTAAGTSTAAVRARLGPTVELLAGRALVVPVAGLDALAATVAAHTGDIGAPPADRFVGHLTLGRLRRGAPRPRLHATAVSATFDVTEIALVESRLGPTGAVYETRYTWLLPTANLGENRPT